MDLPPELWLLIAEHLKGDRGSLWSLCASNVLLPVLYEQAEPTSSSSVVSFCNTIHTSPRQLGQYIHVLNIGTTPGVISRRFWPLRKESAAELRSVLVLLPNLRHLSLATRKAPFELCFNRLALPFMLDKLEISSKSSRSFYAFLSSQPSVTELRLGSALGRGRQMVRSFVAAYPAPLPNLVKITADLNFLEAIVPGRPLSEIVIMSSGASFAGSASLVEDDPWPPFISSLQSDKPRQTLKKLRIVELYLVRSILLTVTFDFYGNLFLR
jgi:hypothetical protein